MLQGLGARPGAPVVQTPISQIWLKPSFCHAANSESGTLASVTVVPLVSDSARNQQRVLIS